jgi:hypothetical protein
MQSQLGVWEKYGGVWKEVERVLSDSIGPGGELLGESSLAKLLGEKEGFDGMSHVGKQEWLEDLENNVAQAVSYLETGRQLEDIGVEAGKVIKFYYNGEELEGTVDEKGNITTSDGRVFDNVFEGFGGKYYAGENEIVEDEKKPKTTDSRTWVAMGKSYKSESEAMSAIDKWESDQLSALENRWNGGEGNYDKGYRESRERIITEQADAYRKDIYSYKTGGLADFTGPAWLDGTKSKPEYILNAEQTKSFFALVDVLSSLDNHKPKNENTVATTIDVDINIETVKEEADVDMLADKVQKAIVTSAQYRNNNFI